MSNTDDPQDTRPNTVRIRRAPKLPAFLIVGGGLGAIATFILTALFPVDPNVGFGALFGYFSLFGVTAGVVVGALVAIILDRRSERRATQGAAVIEVTDAPVFSETEAADEPERETPAEVVIEDAETPGSPQAPTRPAAAPQFFDQDAEPNDKA